MNKRTFRFIRVLYAITALLKKLFDVKDLQEFRGEWFSPKREGIKLPGILTINRKENNFKLTLFSEKDIAGEIISERNCNILNYCKIILGRTSKGDVTLYKHSGDEGGAPMLEHAIT